MYILYNADGSIYKKDLEQYIQVGNAYANVLFISIAEHSPSDYNFTGLCTLPNGVKTTMLIGETGTKTIGGVSYDGKYISLTEAETIMKGTIRINLQAIRQSVILVTYSLYLNVNESAYDNASPATISWQNYNLLMEHLDEIEDDLNGKLDKITTAGSYGVYGVSNGNQTLYNLSKTSTQLYANYIVQRDTNGVINTATPTENTHAANKQYVDNLIASVKTDAYRKVDTTTYPTLESFLASTGEEGYMYLYPINTSDLTKGYHRYIWENNAWLSMGTTQIDLSDYYTKSQVDTALTGKQNTITSSTDLVAQSIDAGIVYSTAAPTAANTNGLKIVVLNSEPATRYDGWLYIILA